MPVSVKGVVELRKALNKLAPDIKKQMDTEIREALKLRDYPTVERLIDIVGSVVNFAQGGVAVRNGQVFYRDHEVRGSVVDRILQMVRENFDAQPMLKFLNNLMKIPASVLWTNCMDFLKQLNCLLRTMVVSLHTKRST